jgi:hypothetical protein
MSPIKAKMPMPQNPGKAVLKVPVAQLPQPPVVKVLPPVFQLPHPIDNICPDNPMKCPPQPIGNPGNPQGGGTVVIVAPPVEVPVAVPVAVPARIGGGGTSFAGQARPSAASQCSAAGNTPALAAGIDQLLPTAQLSKADRAEVTELRQTIQVPAAEGKVGAARDVEEVAMKVLGCRKAWPSCGVRTFDWERQVASAEAVQPK